MTLFTTLLVLIAERLFKLGEHWQLDHRLEVLFRRVKHYSLLTTLLMTVAAAAVVFIIQRLLQGQLFNIPLLVFWILLVAGVAGIIASVFVPALATFLGSIFGLCALVGGAGLILQHKGHTETRTDMFDDGARV